MTPTNASEDADNLERMWVDWIVNTMIPKDLQVKIHQTHRLSHDELLIVNRASCAIHDIKNIIARFPKSGTLSTNESIAKLLAEQEFRLKKHITRRTAVPEKVVEYLARDLETASAIDDADASTSFLVSGIKLKMREIACTLIDEYNAMPVRAADATFAYFEGRPEAYDNKLSFRSTVYNHYEISRGCKPSTGRNPMKDLLKLKQIIPGLL